jgi:hypothetical protein
MLVLVLYVPPLRELFHFSGLRVDDLAIGAGAGIMSVFGSRVSRSFDGFSRDQHVGPRRHRLCRSR